MRFALFVGLLMLPTASNAVCIQYTGSDFSSQVNNTIDWLVCLHNEQNDAINTQANALSNLTRTVNTNADVFNSQKDNVARLQLQMSSAEPLLEALLRMIDELSAENEALAKRVDALEKGQ